LGEAGSLGLFAVGDSELLDAARIWREQSRHMPRLKVTHPNSERTEYEFGDVSVSIGRDQGSMIVLDDPQVSRHHAEIAPGDDGWCLNDLQSANGIVVKGRKVTRLQLRDQTGFEIGGHRFRFMLASGERHRNKEPEGHDKLLGQEKQTSRESLTSKKCAPELRQGAAKVTAKFVLPWWCFVAVVVVGALLAYQVLPVRMESGLPPSTRTEEVAETETTQAGDLREVAPIAMTMQESDAALHSVEAPVSEETAGVPVIASEAPKQAPLKSANVAVDQPQKLESAASDEVVLLRIRPGQSEEMHVVSPDMRRVLHLSTAGKSSVAATDLMLNDKIVFEGIRVATQADMSFATEGDRWLVHGTVTDGRHLIVLPDRRYQVVGSLQSLVTNKDFSVVAHVSRHEDEDRLHINGQLVSSYRHIVSAQISENGRRWAYVAVKDPESAHSSRPAGERVITDTGQGPVADRVSELRLSPDGTRMAHVAHRSGGLSLFVDGRLVHDVAPGARETISQLTFSPTGHRFAWMFSREGSLPVFHVDKLPPIAASVSDVVANNALFPRKTIEGLIRFSHDGRHIACAITGRGSAVYLDGVRMGEYPALQLDSLTFSQDGQRLAFVTLHPREEEGGDEGEVQWLNAQLLVSGEHVQTAPMFIRRLRGSLSVKVGGFEEIAFSQDSAHVAATVLGVSHADGAAFEVGVFVDGEKVPVPGERIDRFCWAGPREICLLCRSSLGQTLRRIDVQR